MASITLDDVHLVYKRSGTGVHGINLDVADGEFVAMVGPSGSGKTTVLRAVAGFIRPQAGAIRIGEREVHGEHAWVPPQKRDLGMVFQQHAIWPHWSVGRNVAYPLRLRGTGRAERERLVADALTQVGLDGTAGRRPDTLSGGQRQRVALARALVTRPAALLLDEALSSLDEPLRERLRTELKQLATDFGLTTLHVTHDRAEALALADRILVLNGGVGQQLAPPNEILHEPANAFVASFMGGATLVEGRLVHKDGTTTFLPTGTDLTFEVETVHRRGDRSTEVGSLAILPDDVDLVAASDPGTIKGEVRSVLFDRSGYTVVIGLIERTMRIDNLREAPRIGDPVHVRVRRALFFGGPAADAGTPSGPTASAEEGANR